MPEPIIWVETLHNPRSYSPAQIEYAAAFASQLDRGKLVIAEPPALRPRADNDGA